MLNDNVSKNTYYRNVHQSHLYSLAFHRKWQFLRYIVRYRMWLQYSYILGMVKRVMVLQKESEMYICFILLLNYCTLVLK